MTEIDLHSELVEIIDPVRGYVRAHLSSPEDAEDVVQETLVRVLAAKRRMTPDVTVAYAIVVARHLLADRVAGAERERWARPRLIDLTEPGRPEDSVVDTEERAALATALAGLPSGQRDALLSHVLEHNPVVAMAAGTGTNSASVAAQLARTRARLRLDYVLALRKVDLPTQRCRPVLLSISAADKRRQLTLRAGQHLLTCPVCSDVSEPLVKRRGGLAAILPWLGLGPVVELLRRLAQAPRPTTTTATAIVVTATAVTALGATALVVAIQNPPAAVSAPTPTSSGGGVAGSLVRTADGGALLPAPPRLASMDGDAVRATAVPVDQVAADEGFWVGGRGNDRIWVQLVVGGESAATVRAGDKVSFTGTVERQRPDFAEREGVTRAEGAALLTRQGAHLRVEATALKITA